MSLRKYMAAEPCKAMDKLQEKFTSCYGALLKSGCVQWDTSAAASCELIGWALMFKMKDGIVPLIDQQDARDLDILCTNAEALLKRDKSKVDPQ